MVCSVALAFIDLHVYLQFIIYSVPLPYILLVQPVSIDDHNGNLQLESATRGAKGQGDHLQDTENRKFTYKELEKFTDNFERFIGQGGFGPVYFGCLEEGTMVAIKIRSESSSHGLDEFLAEVPIFPATLKYS